MTKRTRDRSDGTWERLAYTGGEMVRNGREKWRNIIC
jgi:hypothetical protein